MSRQRRVAILYDGLWAHPAVQAWITLRPATVTPESIHVLRERRRSAVYRLVGAGPAGTAVIAKRCLPAQASLELTVYERILPQLPVTAPRCYGARAGDGQSCWLFLEDVGAERYSESNGTHVAATSTWVALMHTSAAGVAAAQALPDAGPARYLAHLRAARDTIQRRLASPVLTPCDVAVLQAIVSLQDLLESRWTRIEESCVGLPATLVHGDFQPKNVYVREHANGIACYPVDWEFAGWGVPAADLTRIDVAAYWSASRQGGDGPALETVRRLASVGQIFRFLAAIDWECASPPLELEILQTGLVDAVRTAEVGVG